MTERDLAEQGDRRGDGQGRADLGRRQSDDVGEVQRGRRHEGAVAHRVDQRGDGENPQRVVEGNPSPGQPVGLVDGRHKPAIYLDVKIKSPRLSSRSACRARHAEGLKIAGRICREALARGACGGLEISPRHRFAGGGPKI